MRDSDALGGLTERLLQLRSFSLFAALPVGDLAPLARALEERRWEAGADLPEGADGPPLRLVIDGAAEVHRHGQVLQRVPAPGIVGLHAVVADQASGEHQVRAATALRTLELDGDAFQELLDDSFPLLVQVLRTFAAELLAGAGSGLTQAARFAVRAQSREEPAAAKLNLVERVIALRTLAPFRGAGIDALSVLAKRLVVVDPGGAAEALLRQGHFVVVLSGTVALQAAKTGAAPEPAIPAATAGAPARPATGTALYGAATPGQPPRPSPPDSATPVAAEELLAGAPSLLGLLEALIGSPPRLTATPRGPVTALHADIEAFLDTLEDHPDMARTFLAACARRVMRGWEGS